MPFLDDSVSLRQMLDHAREAADLAQGRQRADLDSDRLLGLALLQLMFIVCDAADHVSPQGRQDNPDIPWEHIAALRNRLIHGYDVIDYDVLWQIIASDLPALVASLEKAVASEK
jgi:uncharacterized protein with HEPN domain